MADPTNGMKRRWLPIVTETIVIILLLAGFIYGAVTTSTGRGACAPTAVRREGDGDDGEGGAVVRGNGAGGTACALTKGATAFTVSLDATFLYTVH